MFNGTGQSMKIIQLMRVHFEQTVEESQLILKRFIKNFSTYSDNRQLFQISGAK